MIYHVQPIVMCPLLNFFDVILTACTFRLSYTQETVVVVAVSGFLAVIRLEKKMKEIIHCINVISRGFPSIVLQHGDCSSV